MEDNATVQDTTLDTQMPNMSESVLDLESASASEQARLLLLLLDDFL